MRPPMMIDSLKEKLISTEGKKLYGYQSKAIDAILERSAAEITEAQAYDGGWIALYHDGTDPARPMTFEEARSEVVNQVQTQMEAQLTARLREQYNVSVYPEVLKQLER